MLERGFHGYGSDIKKEVSNRIKTENQLILDVGTGSGRNVRFLANILSDSHIFSIDPSLKALETVKDVLKQESMIKYVTLLGGVAENIPLKENSVDLVFSVMSLHHIKKVRSSLQEMVRVLNKSGKLMIVDWTPEASELMNQSPDHFLPLSELKKVVDDLGFTHKIKKYSKWYISEIMKNNR